ncbi:hypothetical protein C9374_012598 [Naegleria lovaniensis]|uniref:Uncharacterized protein n=1 Tax=Naegleria lovaniensis TaxID=51637 RepID=A0AA88KQC7_NAELO|nr:uncharacterized protein C9374_012598 [Naegleria lovaniensis]KAG2392346.1 hypothetical protein C9374_012598 [Naegleria lovaniensis]
MYSNSLFPLSRNVLKHQPLIHFELMVQHSRYSSSRWYSTIFSRDLKKRSSTTTHGSHSSSSSVTTTKNGPFHQHNNSAKTSHHPMHSSTLIAHHGSLTSVEHSMVSGMTSTASYGHIFARDLRRKEKKTH